MEPQPRFSVKTKMTQASGLLPLLRIPHEGGSPDLWNTIGRLALFWIPAFAGNSDGGWVRNEDEEEWERADLEVFLMLSLSKHEEGATDPHHSQVHAAAQMG